MTIVSTESVTGILAIEAPETFAACECFELSIGLAIELEIDDAPVSGVRSALSQEAA